jgi:hypothetical protein
MYIPFIVAKNTGHFYNFQSTAQSNKSPNGENSPNLATLFLCSLPSNANIFAPGILVALILAPFIKQYV